MLDAWQTVWVCVALTAIALGVDWLGARRAGSAKRGGNAALREQRQRALKPTLEPQPNQTEVKP